MANNPVNWTDPWGLKTYLGKRAIHGFKKRYGKVHHQFIFVENPNLPKGRKVWALTGPFVSGPGSITTDDPWDYPKRWGGELELHDGVLFEVPNINEDKLIQLLTDEENRFHWYELLSTMKGFPFINNCQTWAKRMLKKCK